MRQRSRASVRTRFVTVVAMTLVGAVACTGGKPGAPTSAPTATPHRGGSVVLGAEGWPKCLNPITDCADDVWYRYTVGSLILPRLVPYSNDMTPEPSALITEVPSLENGGLTQHPFAVTYHLAPAAVWSDGTPITCDDVDFTWKAINHSTVEPLPYDWTASGVAGISRIECPDPRTVTLDFNKVYTDWPELFGGTSGFILEQAAFRNVPGFPDRPDLKDEMKQSIPFSGGPWTLDSWSRDREVLVPNPKYWGTRSHLSKVTILPQMDPDVGAASIQDGDVDAIFPSASTVPLAHRFGAEPDIATAGGSGQVVDALWFQLDRPPLNDPRVRQALAHAMAGDAVVEGVTRPHDPNAEVNDCGPWIPGPGTVVPGDRAVRPVRL